MAEEQQSPIKTAYNSGTVGLNMDQSVNQIKPGTLTYANYPGIYIIYNIVNNKCYIGSSTNIHRRINNHKSLLNRNKHHSYKLQLSFNKHKENNFVFKELVKVYFPENYTKQEKSEYLECLEEYYIKEYNAYSKGYNVSEIPKIVGNTNTKESITKGIKTRIEKNSYVCSDETKLKRLNSLKNNKFFKEQHRLGAIKRRKKIYQYDLNNNFIKEFLSKEDASLCLNISKRSIHKNLLKITKSCNLYRFYYLKQE
jgi:group I intron endonuclease